MKKIYIYKRFERFWHWAQALLILVLAFTGFEVHGSYRILGFERAVVIHNYAGFTLITLIAFAIFWHFTTGEWRHYIPTTDRLREMVYYYLKGIFQGEKKPVGKSEKVKLNPLQKITYTGYKVAIVPVMIATGLIYYYVAHGDIHLRSVKYIAIIHSLGAFILIAFTVIHVYMTTTGPTLTSHIKAMFTGWDEVEEEDISSN